MTARKPTGHSWESWIDAQVNHARDNGEFDALPGAGKPIPGLDQPHDEMWWVRNMLKREGVSFLPETLQLRRDVEVGLDEAMRSRSRRGALRTLEALNKRIAYVNSRSGSLDGPASTVSLIDVDTQLERWDNARAEARADAVISGPGIAAIPRPAWHDAADLARQQRIITLALIAFLTLFTLLLAVMT